VKNVTQPVRHVLLNGNVSLVQKDSSYKKINVLNNVQMDSMVFQHQECVSLVQVIVPPVLKIPSLVFLVHSINFYSIKLVFLPVLPNIGQIH
jgi:hypothetical protein